MGSNFRGSTGVKTRKIKSRPEKEKTRPRRKNKRPESELS